MVYERPHMQLKKMFALRGWQRRRLIPVHHTERELRQIVGGVAIELNDLFGNPLWRLEQVDKTFSNKKSSSTAPDLSIRKVAR